MKTRNSGKVLMTVHQGLKARDVMSPTVITASLGMSVEEVVELLNQHRVSGVPVVNEEGILVGVISQTDLIRYQAGESRYARPTPVYYRVLDDEDVDLIDDRFMHEAFDEVRVVDLYTPVAISAAADIPLENLALRMVKKEIHRVIITENRRPIGIVSTMDILRGLFPRIGDTEDQIQVMGSSAA